MPTGYTAAISDGVSLRQFILSCARGMGACIMQRDDPMSDLPKKREPEDYHAKQIAKANNRLVETKAMSEEVAQKKANEEYDAEIKSIEDSILKNNKLRRQYETMLSQVNSWVPPTSEHFGLKEFMVSQITESMQFDCGGSYYSDMLKKLKPPSGVEWKNKEIQDALKDLDYHTREHNAEVARCTSQNKWIDALYESLPNEDRTSCAPGSPAREGSGAVANSN